MQVQLRVLPLARHAAVRAQPCTLSCLRTCLQCMTMDSGLPLSTVDAPRYYAWFRARNPEYRLRFTRRMLQARAVMTMHACATSCKRVQQAHAVVLVCM